MAGDVSPVAMFTLYSGPLSRSIESDFLLASGNIFNTFGQMDILWAKWTPL